MGGLLALLVMAGKEILELQKQAGEASSSRLE
jgi:hypothetical protein